MKNLFLLLFSLLFYWGQIACAQKLAQPKANTSKKSTNTADTSPVNIARTKGVLRFSDHFTTHDNRKRITQKERDELQIDKIDFSHLSINSPNNMLAMGKVIHQNSLGTLRTILAIGKGEWVAEYLVSYNKNGEFVAVVEVGQINGYSGKCSETLFSGNKITYLSIEEGETEKQYYNITPELKFVERKK